MNDVLHTAAERARPLVARLQSRIAVLDLVLADETSMRLQDREKRGFVWVFHGHDSQTDGELVLYVFATDRSGETPAQILGGTRGTLVVDGYTGYNNVTDPEGRSRAGCWCHLRRKLFEARREIGDDADVGISKVRPLSASSMKQPQSASLVPRSISRSVRTRASVAWTTASPGRSRRSQTRYRKVR